MKPSLTDRNFQHRPAWNITPFETSGLSSWICSLTMPSLAALHLTAVVQWRTTSDRFHWNGTPESVQISASGTAVAAVPSCCHLLSSAVTLGASPSCRPGGRVVLPKYRVNCSLAEMLFYQLAELLKRLRKTFFN